MPKWRNRQTRQSQKLLGGNSRVGSSPTFGTTSVRKTACFRVPTPVGDRHKNAICKHFANELLMSARRGNIGWLQPHLKSQGCRLLQAREHMTVSI